MDKNNRHPEIRSGHKTEEEWRKFDVENLEKQLLAVIDFLGNNPDEAKQVNAKIWEHLLIYAKPQPITKDLAKRVFGIELEKIVYNPFNGTYILHEKK